MPVCCKNNGQRRYVFQVVCLSARPILMNKITLGGLERISSDSEMNWLEFCGQRSRSQVTKLSFGLNPRINMLVMIIFHTIVEFEVITFCIPEAKGQLRLNIIMFCLFFGHYQAPWQEQKERSWPSALLPGWRYVWSIHVLQFVASAQQHPFV